MRLIPRNVNEIPSHTRIGFKPTANYKLLTEFVESDHECVELVDYSYSNRKSAQNSLAASVRRFKISSVKVVVRKERVFLVKVH